MFLAVCCLMVCSFRSFSPATLLLPGVGAPGSGGPARDSQGVSSVTDFPISAVGVKIGK